MVNVTSVPVHGGKLERGKNSLSPQYLFEKTQPFAGAGAVTETVLHFFVHFTLY